MAISSLDEKKLEVLMGVFSDEEVASIVYGLERLCDELPEDCEDPEKAKVLYDAAKYLHVVFDNEYDERELDYATWGL